MLFEHSGSRRKNSLAQDCVTTDSRPNLSEMNEFEFGFDFDENNWELLLERDDAVSGFASQAEAVTTSAVVPKIVPFVPVVVAKRSSQFMHKRIPSKSRKSSKIKQKVDKNAGCTPLLASPQLDKAQSLLYFPNNFARHTNSGDKDALRRLFNQHLQSTCKVTMFGHVLDVRSFWALHMLMQDLTPDVVMCVHATQVTGNQVRGSAYLKYTDKKVLFEAATKNISNTELKSIYGTERNKKLRKTLQAGNQERPPEVEKQYNALVEADVDVVMYVSLDIILTFDFVTRKVVDMMLDSRITSMKAADTL